MIFTGIGDIIEGTVTQRLRSRTILLSQAAMIRALVEGETANDASLRWCLFHGCSLPPRERDVEQILSLLKVMSPVRDAADV